MDNSKLTSCHSLSLASFCVCLRLRLLCLMNFYFFKARSISDDLSSGDAARFRDDEYGKSEASGMGASSSSRNESAHKGEKDKEKREKDKEDRDEGK